MISVKTTNGLIGYGIPIFTAGFFLGIYWWKYLLLLIPVGSLMTFVGVFFFFKNTNLTEHFKKDRDEDFLTFFWNVIVLKFWTLMFMLWMISMNLTLLFSGLLRE